MTGRPRRSGSTGRQEHLDWLSTVEVTGPFLTVPVLFRVWPTLEAVDKPTRESLAVALPDAPADPAGWTHWVLTNLLGWGDALDDGPGFDLPVAEYDQIVTASFALRDPATNDPVLLGITTAPGRNPAARLPDEVWAATPIDRLAMLCRAHGVELGLVTDGRWWALVWAPRGKVTTSAVFDSISWTDSTDRVIVRAFKSLLERSRFFGVPDDQRLPALLAESIDNEEEITEQLGVQVREAVELLVQAIGRDEERATHAGAAFDNVDASDVYRGAVTVMMRIVFLLYAEERALLPSDNSIYAAAYSAARLGEQLQARANEAGEENLQASHTGWYRLLALFGAVYSGVDHPRLALHAYDGSIFDPTEHPWLADIRVDDQAVLHMLASVQKVTIKGETRRLSFRSLDVEQIGYVYEGLLSFDAFHADDVVVGLVGKAGVEDEIHLTHLEEVNDQSDNPYQLAQMLAERYKSSGIGSTRAIERRLIPLDGAALAAARGKLAAVTANDIDLIERLIPFYGLLRTDLRGLPVVIRPGALYVTSSGLRASTGTHYTPRFLAEQVVEGALEPLIFSPGPLQTANKNAWQPRTSTQILALKVADIAMGSGAFLVAACRYLAKALLEAWAREGDPRAVAATTGLNDAVGTIDTEVDPVVTEARRQIIEHCLYGVDINPMAVEMAKLSLWLVSMDPLRPFTFLDDRLVAGDSLLGITTLDQLEAMHLDPARGRKLHEGGMFEFTEGIRDLLRQAAKDRAELAGMPGETLAELQEKRSRLATVGKNTSLIRRYADLLTGASLANAGRGQAGLDTGSNLAMTHIQSMTDGVTGAAERANSDLIGWLHTDLPDGGFPREPLHWPMAFPEVFDGGGFDAIVGNPPFQGGTRISGTWGKAYRQYIGHAIAKRRADRCDLAGYFLLRAARLLDQEGSLGLILTNSISQGDTREVGLERLLNEGLVIFRARKSESWPSRSAKVFYSEIGMTRSSVGSIAPVLDGAAVTKISSYLEGQTEDVKPPRRLTANVGLAFEGCKPNGKGFILDTLEAHVLLRETKNRRIVRPYLIGEDVTTDPSSAASRWIIDFNDLSETSARKFPAVFDIVESRVRPERQRLKDGRYALRSPLPERFWQFGDRRPNMRSAIAQLDYAVAVARVSKLVMPTIVSTDQILGDSLTVFATDDAAMLAFLSSAAHYWWAITYSSTMKGDLRYTPTDIFETLARPTLTEQLRSLGARLDASRRNVMKSRQAGLTKTYNLVHDPACADEDIIELREIHRVIDEGVCRAYGWDDVLVGGLDHGFHDTRQGVRYTVGPLVRQEILDRLLQLNHKRFAAEQESGIGGSRKTVKRAADQPELFA